MNNAATGRDAMGSERAAPNDDNPNVNASSTQDTQRNRRQNSSRRNGNALPRFQGSCDELKEHVYNTSTSHSNADLSSKTTTAIGEYVAREYTGASEFRNGLVKLTLPTLQAPPDPAAGDAVQMEKWKLDFQEYRKKLADRERNMGKVYSLVLGQCAPTIRDRIEASADWESINNSSDAIKLLVLIRQSLYQRATRRKPTHALIEAEIALMRFHQHERMTNSEYLELLRELVEVYEHLGGEPGVSRTRVNTLLQDPDKATKAERAKAKADAREEYLAVLLLLNSDTKQFRSLITDLENQHTRGLDGYPTTLTAAYDMLVNYKTPQHNHRSQHQETGIAFAQVDEDENSNSKHPRERNTNTGRGQGGRGRGRGRGSAGRTPERSDEGNNLNATETPYPTPSITTLIGAPRDISPGWLLLDSCSTGNLICNSRLLHDIHTVSNPITIHLMLGR